MIDGRAEMSRLKKVDAVHVRQVDPPENAHRRNQAHGGAYC